MRLRSATRPAVRTITHTRAEQLLRHLHLAGREAGLRIELAQGKESVHQRARLGIRPTLPPQRFVDVEEAVAVTPGGRAAMMSLPRARPAVAGQFACDRCRHSL